MILGMFDHVGLAVSDRAASLAFYELLLGAPTHVTSEFVEWDDFGITEREPTRGLKHCFIVGGGAKAAGNRQDLHVRVRKG